jgi:dUTP pyrophosphatase
MVEEVSVSIIRLPGGDDLLLPAYMTVQAAGMDLPAAIDGERTILPGDWQLIPTGFIIELPDGFEAELRPRSGLALKHGVTLLNSPGTIDADYRGEIKLILINHGKEPFVVRRGDRIGQMVVHRVSRVVWEQGSNASPTARGENGFGHTGHVVGESAGVL